MDEIGIADWRALDRRVLVVAVKRIPGEWCAYIGAVPGESHLKEIQHVRKYGSKLSESIALTLFPQFKGVPYAW